MAGCGRVPSRRLSRVLGTAVAVTAVIACLAGRVAPPVITARAEAGTTESPNRPPPTATPRATPMPTPRPTATATPHPTPAPPTPEPTRTPEPTATALPTPAGQPHTPAAGGDGGTATPAPQPAATPAPATAPEPAPSSTPRPPTPQATPSLGTQLSALPAAVAAYAQDGQGHTSPYVVGADSLAAVSVASSLALAVLRRRGLL